MSNPRLKDYDSGINLHQVFQFGVFNLNAETGELRKHGVKLRLPDQPVQVLTLLLERSGEVISREEIQKRLWPENTYVDFDNAINSSVRKLRDALGDSADNPRFIETLSRRGYRFIAPVSRAPGLERQPAVEKREPIPKRRRNWWAVGIASAALIVGIAASILWRVEKTDNTSGEAPFPAVPLTGNPGFETGPSFSPEGTRVAYSWEEPGKHVSNIYVKLVGPGDPVRLTSGVDGDFGPAWSPDGRSIAFLRARAPFRAAVMITSAMGGQERELAEVTLNTRTILGHWRALEVPPPYLVWSSDGKWLLSTEQARPGESASLVRISVESGEKRVITSPPVHGNGDGALALSPDGKQLAFARSAGLFERDIYLLKLAEDASPKGEPRRLTAESKEIDGLSWTPDGQRLVFSSKRGGRLELWQLRVAGSGKAVRLNAPGEDPREVAVSKEGRHLVYSHQFFHYSVWRFPLSGKTAAPAAPLIASARSGHHSKYSPDGKQIAFESNRSGSDEIWVCNADGSNQVQLTSFRSWAGSPRWSPDGQKIAFDGNAAGNWDIYVINSHGGKPRRLTAGAANEYRPSWSHDGKWIYYASTQTGHVQVWKMPSSGGTAVQVTKNGGAVAFESTDGSDLYYTKGQGLWKVPVKGGGEVQVLRSLLGNAFAPVKRGIYFAQASAAPDGRVHINLLDFTTHAVKPITDLSVTFFSNEISVSPDEQYLLADQADRDTSELMIVENFY